MCNEHSLEVLSHLKTTFFLNGGRYSSRCQKLLFHRKCLRQCFFDEVLDLLSDVCGKNFWKFSEHLFWEYNWRAPSIYNASTETCLFNDKVPGFCFILSMCKMTLDIVLTFIFTLFFIITYAFTTITYTIKNCLPYLLTINNSNFPFNNEFGFAMVFANVFHRTQLFARLDTILEWNKLSLICLLLLLGRLSPGTLPVTFIHWILLI